MINGYYKMQSFLYSCRPVWVELLFSALHGREYLSDLISLGDHRRQQIKEHNSRLERKVEETKGRKNIYKIQSG